MSTITPNPTAEDVLNILRGRSVRLAHMMQDQDVHPQEIIEQLADMYRWAKSIAPEQQGKPAEAQ